MTSLKTFLASRREWLGGLALGTLAGSSVGARSLAQAAPEGVDTKPVLPSVPAAVALRSGVSPLDFEGGIDDRVASAITHAIERVETLDLGGLSELALARPMVLSRPHPGHPGAWVAPKSVRGGGTRIVASAPMDCLVEMRNCFGKVFEGFRLDGQNRARTLLDTSWTVSPAPAMNCRWSDLDLRGAAGPISWRADHNNDCDFAFVGIQGPQDQPGHVAISLQCSGGDLSLFRVRSYGGKLLLAAQSITLTNCQTNGVKVFGKDFNLLSFSGGYHYAAADSHANIEIDGDAALVALKADGGHFENGYPGGVVLGGTGVLRGNAAFVQCHVFGPGEGPRVRMVGPGVRSSMGSGIRQIARLIGGSYQQIDLSDAPQLVLSCEDINHDQVAVSRRRAGGAMGLTEDAGIGLYRQEHPGWGALATLRSASTAECATGRIVRLSMEGWPATGRLFVRSTNDRCPRGMLDYDVPSGSVIAAGGFGAGRLRAAIRDGMLELTHDVAGASTVFLVGAIGL